MEKESDHLEDFAPELAMVTKFGNEEPGHPWSLEVWFNGSNIFK
jgi:prolyl-tRNA synthetase